QRLAPARDRVVERHQVGVALALRDLLRRDHLLVVPDAAARAEMEHGDRAEQVEERCERRAVGLALAPAEERLVDGRLLARLALEPRDVSGDAEQEIRVRGLRLPGLVL